MRHAAVTAPVPLALYVSTRPPEFKVLIEGWRDSPEVADLTRRACTEALGLG
jgi:hypothetical protein